jgi:hypothetical protein
MFFYSNNISIFEAINLRGIGFDYPNHNKIVEKDSPRLSPPRNLIEGFFFYRYIQKSFTG